MNQDDIIRMAKEAGFKPRHNAPREWWMLTEDIERFAALVAKHEREACAKLIEDIEIRKTTYSGWLIRIKKEYAEEIRKRGKE